MDYYWPELGLVVECDGGAFHRTAAQQTRDRRRDHAHQLAGLIPLRFTHAEIAFEREYVEREYVERVLRTWFPMVVSRRHGVRN